MSNVFEIQWCCNALFSVVNGHIVFIRELMLMCPFLWVKLCKWLKNNCSIKVNVKKKIVSLSLSLPVSICVSEWMWM